MVPEGDGGRSLSVFPSWRGGRLKRLDTGREGGADFPGYAETHGLGARMGGGGPRNQGGENDGSGGGRAGGHTQDDAGLRQGPADDAAGGPVETIRLPRAIAEYLFPRLYLPFKPGVIVKYPVPGGCPWCSIVPCTCPPGSPGNPYRLTYSPRSAGAAAGGERPGV